MCSKVLSSLNFNVLTIDRERACVVFFSDYILYTVNFPNVFPTAELTNDVNAYFHRWEFIENLMKFTPIWELKLKNLS